MLKEDIFTKTQKNFKRNLILWEPVYLKMMKIRKPSLLLL